MAVLCSYNPKETNSFKYWCRWENGQCLQLVGSKGLVKEQYEGRLALYEEPGNGTYTVILNQLTAQDAGFYWCLTSGDPHWRSTVELKIVEGKSRARARGKGGSPRTLQSAACPHKHSFSDLTTPCPWGRPPEGAHLWRSCVHTCNKFPSLHTPRTPNYHT